jgi:hypothetical protein
MKPLFIVLACNTVLSIGLAYYLHKKGRSFTNYVLINIFLSIPVGILIYLKSKGKRTSKSISI